MAVDAAGARDAVRIYRLLLQAGADTRAVAKVPAKFVFAGTEAAATKEKAASNGTNRLISAAPRDLAGGAAAAELAALELEVAEAPRLCSTSQDTFVRLRKSKRTASERFVTTTGDG